MTFINPDRVQIKSLLNNIKIIAVLGLSPKNNRPSFQVAKSLQGFGYRIIPVRPAVTEVLGEKAYPDLDSLKRTTDIKIDLLDVFRAPQYVDDIVDQCIELEIPAIWLQDGVINHSAALRAQQAGIFTIMDRCIYRDYITFIK
ncbi:MAG: CoA-binding protein [Gammaproteobacteria bacterium]